MDLVVLQADNSDGEELRYTLRSIEKNIDGIDKLYVIGKRPDWLMTGNCIPCPDRHPIWDKEKNMFDKIFTACKQEFISEKFLYCSDDVYTCSTHCPQILIKYNANSFPLYNCGDLHEKVQKRSSTDPYKNAILNTISALHRKCLSTINYDIHTPMIIDKFLFLDIMNKYDWNVAYGYVIKSLYQNSARPQTAVTLEDNKIHTPKTVAAIHRMIDGKPFFSTNEYSFNDEMREVLQSLFPNPSRWEVKTS